MTDILNYLLALSMVFFGYQIYISRRNGRAFKEVRPLTVSFDITLLLPWSITVFTAFFLKIIQHVDDMKKYIYLLFYCFVCSLPLFAQKDGTSRQRAISRKDIFIPFDCVKHLVFPVQVSDIATGEQELVMVSRVEEVPYVVRLSVQAEGFIGETNLTVVCIDGSVYTYRIHYFPESGTNSHPNIYEDNGKWQHHDYQAEVSDLHLAEFFFPENITYGTPGSEVSLTLTTYNNQLEMSAVKNAVAYSNLFVVDKVMNTYHITIKRGNTSVFTYSFDNQRRYTAHVDVNSEKTEGCIQELRTKKHNIYSLGVIENKFELSMANLYVRKDFIFFIFDLKNKSYIDYDIKFVKHFQRDQRKSRNVIQQETAIEPIYQKDFNTKIESKGRNRLILGFDKFTIPDDKVSEIEIYERNGGRHIKPAVLNEYTLSTEPLYKPQP